MALTRCACLPAVREDRVMLVRVRDNELWYLPGGTIEPGESPVQALVREVAEELGVALDPSSIAFDRRVVGPAYGRQGQVELNCYRADWSGTVEPFNEVSEIGWLGASDVDRVAPAIKLLFEGLWLGGERA